jgi:2-methylcitrate dehydratase
MCCRTPVGKPMTFLEALADWTAAVRETDVPLQVQTSARLALADTLGGALAAAYEPESPALDACRAVIPSDGPVTVFGGGRTDLRGAALLNCTYARYLDVNDLYIATAGRDSGHFSDVLPAVVACAEAADADGADLLTAAVVAYEIQAALAEAFLWMRAGLHSTSQVAVAAALAGGRLLGLDRSQQAHAAAIALTSGTLQQTWLLPGRDTAIKGPAAGFAAERGVLAAQLAARGLTGPVDAFETMCSRFSGGDPRLDLAGSLGSVWRTPRQARKLAAAQIFLQPLAEAGIALHREGVPAADVREVTVRGTKGTCAGVQGSPEAYTPTSREDADHSAPFVLALALRSGRVLPCDYRGSPWTDPGLLRLMGAITLDVDDTYQGGFDEGGEIGASVSVRLADGRSHSHDISNFLGHPDNPVGPEQITEKLANLLEVSAGRSPGVAKSLVDACLSGALDLPAMLGQLSHGAVVTGPANHDRGEGATE